MLKIESQVRQPQSTTRENEQREINTVRSVDTLAKWKEFKKRHRRMKKGWYLMRQRHVEPRIQHEIKQRRQ
jgi:hypothetical protein